MTRRGAVAAAAAILVLASGSADSASARRPHRCARPASPALPGWARARRMTVLVDSVLLGGASALRAGFPCWRVSVRGRPALMVRFAERELRLAGQRVAPLVVVGLGYNSLWERHRRRYGFWARRFDREASGLLSTLRRRGARQVVWVTLRQPTTRTVPLHARGELGQYSWYFPYANERLRRLDRRRRDVVLAPWRAVSDRPGVTYDTIHLNPFGARLMARTIRTAVAREARGQSRGKRRRCRGSCSPSARRTAPVDE